MKRSRVTASDTNSDSVSPSTKQHRTMKKISTNVPTPRFQSPPNEANKHFHHDSKTHNIGFLSWSSRSNSLEFRETFTNNETFRETLVVSQLHDKDQAKE
jgi:hypothetical protein